MNAQEINKKIKERGYFEVIFEPSVYEQILICERKLDCKKIIEDARIKLRGWDYPHVPYETNEVQQIPYAFEKGVESWVNFGINKEIWRLYQSGQFIHRFAVIEDWLKEDGWFKREDIEPGKSLDVIGVIYRFTEIFEFLKRLFNNNSMPSDGGKILIRLNNTKNRVLEILFDKMRASLFGEYKTSIDPIRVEMKFTKDEILNNAKNLALKSCTQLFDDFNWENQPIDVFKKDQDKFLNRQI